MVRRWRYVVVCCSVLVALEARAQNGGLRGAIVDEKRSASSGCGGPARAPWSQEP